MSENEDRGAQPVSRGRRFFKLAGMTAAVATNYATNRIKTVFSSDTDEERGALHRVNGERIAQTLGELKGAAMKIGQMASIGSDVLPKELSDALTKLQKDSPPMSYEVIAEQIRSEFGEPPETLFTSFEKEPFAAASIGQVHRARTDDGRDVIVKIQYPGVDSSVDSDLGHLKLALKASGLINKGHRRGLNKVFEEIRERLHEELDYCNEADNVRKFREFHKKHAGIVVPNVIGERSSKRVLTLTYEPGDAITELDERDYSQEVRNRIGENLFIAMAGQIFELQAIQADPNPANYGFRPDGTVVLYDFGCVKELKPEILSAYTDAIRYGIEEDYDRVDRALHDLGARNPDGPPVPAEYYKIWRDIFVEPILHDAPYDYGASKLHDRVVKQIPDFLKRLSSFQPPVELVFLDRTIGGNFGNLRKIRTVAQFKERLYAYLYPNEPAPASIPM